MVKLKIQILILLALFLVVLAVVWELAGGHAPVRSDGSVEQGIEQSGGSPVAPLPTKENVSSLLRAKIEHLRHVADKDSAKPEVAFEVARLLQDSHNPQDAVHYYALGLRHDAKNNNVRIDYSQCLYELGRTTEARTQCKLVLSHDPTNPEALFNLGAIFANDGARDSARAYWLKLIENHPNQRLASQARENLAMLEKKSPTQSAVGP